MTVRQIILAFFTQFGSKFSSLAVTIKTELAVFGLDVIFLLLYCCIMYSNGIGLNVLAISFANCIGQRMMQMSFNGCV